MKIEDVYSGVKVKIPTRKSIGDPLGVFQNRILRDRYNGDFLLIMVHNGDIYLRYPQSFATSQRIPAFIQTHMFLAMDLDKYEEEQPELFRTNHAMDLKEKLEPNKPPVADIETDKEVIIMDQKIGFDLQGELLNQEGFEIKPKHKDWEMGEPSLIETPGPPVPIFNPDGQAELQLLKPKQQGLRYNEGKLDYTLMDMRAFQPMIEVLEYGAHKYSTFKEVKTGIIFKGTQLTNEEARTAISKGELEVVSSGRDNWKLGGPNMSLLSLLGSTMRHLASLLSGELYDKESNLSHIGHLSCNVMFMGHFWEKYLKAKKSKQKSNFLDGIWKSGKP